MYNSLVAVQVPRTVYWGRGADVPTKFQRQKNSSAAFRLLPTTAEIKLTGAAVVLRLTPRR